MDNDLKLIAFIEQVKKAVTELKNLVQDVPQVDSYHVNSKTSFLIDKVEQLDDYLNDIMLDLM